MAFPKKGLRKIVVDNTTYVWAATGQDGWIGLTIAWTGGTGQLVTASFGYHTCMITKKHLIITNYIVRQVIIYALSKGWQPMEKKNQLSLGEMDNMIDLTSATFSPFLSCEEDYINTSTKTDT